MSDISNDLWAAVALVMVMEGVMPFLNPSFSRQTMLKFAEMDDSALRIVGLISMLMGLGLLYWVR
ncbi:MAG: hypothetical protein RIT27_1605 [Pseudomonadota bacterium]|jgi:uncharacterized protein YjeT (DUF2065 family)